MFEWPVKGATSEVKYEEETVSLKDYERSFYVKLIHQENHMVRQEIVEEYTFSANMEYELKTTMNSFKLLENSDFF
ncbi:hypothetical protein EZV73_03905 [Acidaminobacter sp. JC074]|uniref:hypothetical protein n=1 Tax=Acidaminobacter sp. JC074 TaxID=2530199 RepID=UPI001F0DE116|nr:hypothetical protein [Acidaminobacter sp. JC074]MCH4886695.1 hypothetical protein [Acidaminobacter sp. JC074]